MNPGQLESIESASRDELAALQLRRMQASLNHAYQNSAFYRQRFDDHGVHPDDLLELADLAKFPFTTKLDLRDNYPFGMFAVPRDQVVRIHASSGTTGKPTVVGYTQADIDMWAHVMVRSLRAAGVRPGDMMQVSFGYGLFTGGLGAHYAAERMGCTVVPISSGQTEKQAPLIQDFRPDAIMCTPSYLLNIADELERQGCGPGQSSLRLANLGAEPWTDAMRQTIESRLGLEAVDIYGLSEIIGGGVAQECIESKDCPTIWEDHFYPEVIDPDTGAVLPDGEEGELVFTSLTKQALPMIRYRTRDLTRLLAPSARSMRRLERITGRNDDMMIVRGVNVFPSQIEEQILGIEALSPHYQIELMRDANLDQMVVNVEARSQAVEAGLPEVGRELGDRIKAVIGVSVTVNILEVGSVPRSDGKAARVVDKRELA